MTVYVDDAFISTSAGTVTKRAAKWCHMIADTPEELHEFAQALGLKRSWYQDPLINTKSRARPGSRRAENWHYDVTSTKRAQAIKLGAVPVTWREMVEITNRRYQSRNRDDTP